MSGIAGLMTRDGAAPPGKILRAMMAALACRGPDGDGHYRSGDVGMVHTRLATVDLATGDQPLYEPGGAALVGDAAIVNDAESRRDLPDIAFATGSDCEAPLHLYRRHGLDFARRLRGSFALAVHDPTRGCLVLARDRFGGKPLYFAETALFFAFASHPRALIDTGIVAPEVAVRPRNELLQMQFTTGRGTIFAGVERVLPGETLVVRQGRIIERRQDEALPTGAPFDIDDDAALARFDAAFADTVARHLRADPPCGVFLSGGVASMALVAMAARVSDRPVRAFAVGYEDGDGDGAAARALAQSVGAELAETRIDEAAFWRLLPSVVGAIDDPAADYAMLPAYQLGAAAREAGVKVVLSAEGADELFAGYGRYRAVMRPWWAGGRMPRVRGVLDELGVLRGEIAGWRDGIAAAEARGALAGRSRLQVAQAVDCADWLPNDLLARLDRCLAAHAVEGRTPFLDGELAGFALRLPDGLKIRRGLGKFLVRRWLAARFPAADALARKRGTGAPVGRWIAARAGEIGPLVAQSEGVRELCDPDGVRRVFAQAAQRRAGRAAWTLLFYALWHRRHIEGSDLPPDTAAALAEQT